MKGLGKSHQLHDMMVLQPQIYQERTLKSVSRGNKDTKTNNLLYRPSFKDAVSGLKF